MRAPYPIQPSLPFQRHSETSREAAESMCEGKVERDRRAILAELDRWRGLWPEETEGLTDLELQAALEMLGSTERPRRLSLLDEGLIEATASKRKTPSGRWATVWRITEAGRRYLWERQ